MALTQPGNRRNADFGQFLPFYRASSRDLSRLPSRWRNKIGHFVTLRLQYQGWSHAQLSDVDPSPPLELLITEH